MSKEAVNQFRTQVNGNESLQAEIRGMGKVTDEQLVAMAARHGHDFTTEELAAVAGTIGDELSDFEMELVTGGLRINYVMINAADTVAPQPMAEREPSSDDDPLC